MVRLIRGQSRPASMIACANSFGFEKQSSWLPGT
jgi:hypothetical protein